MFFQLVIQQSKQHTATGTTGDGQRSSKTYSAINPPAGRRAGLLSERPTIRHQINCI